MPLTFNEAAEAWVRNHYPESKPLPSSVYFGVEADIHDTYHSIHIEVNWYEMRSTAIGTMPSVRGRPVLRYGEAKKTFVSKFVDEVIDLTELIREITDLALEGTTDGAPRSELHQSERTE